MVDYLNQIDTVWTGQLQAAAAAAGPAPIDQLAGMFDALATACRSDGYRGCGFINAAAEFPSGTVAHDRIVAHKSAVLDWVRGLTAEAGAADPDDLARALTLLLDGALSAGVLDGDARAADVARTAARQLVLDSCDAR